jgi:hypothetical protein
MPTRRSFGIGYSRPVARHPGKFTGEAPGQPWIDAAEGTGKDAPGGYFSRLPVLIVTFLTITGVTGRAIRGGP